MANPEVRRFKLWQDRIQTEVEISGNGPPLVWLHGPWGLNPDRPFVERLGSGNTVYAPRFPGTTRGDPNGVHALVGWLDLAVYHGELFDRLELEAPALACVSPVTVSAVISSLKIAREVTCDVAPALACVPLVAETLVVTELAATIDPSPIRTPFRRQQRALSRHHCQSRPA